MRRASISRKVRCDHRSSAAAAQPGRSARQADALMGWRPEGSAASPISPAISRQCRQLPEHFSVGLYIDLLVRAGLGGGTPPSRRVISSTVARNVCRLRHHRQQKAQVVEAAARLECHDGQLVAVQRRARGAGGPALRQTSAPAPPASARLRGPRSAVSVFARCRETTETDG